MNTITKNQILNVLDYDVEQGIFTWKVSSESSQRLWNKPAGTKRTPDGIPRIVISINYTEYDAGKLAFTIISGKYPNESIVYLDGDRLNLQKKNLKLRSQTKIRNTSMSTREYNKLLWISELKKQNKYVVVISNPIHSKYDRTYCGRFNNIEDAVKCRNYNWLGPYKCVPYKTINN